MSRKSSGSAVQRAENAVLLAAMKRRNGACKICGAIWTNPPEFHEHDCPVLALQRARAAARRQRMR